MTAPRHLLAHPADDVAVLLAPAAAGEAIAGVRAAAPIPAGHKIAVRPVAPGQPVRKFGQPIGLASAPICPGDHVHSHNLAFVPDAIDFRPGSNVREPQAAAEPRHFLGYARADGRVGTRNFIGILTSVNCSATVARRIAAHFTPERLAPFPEVDGVVAFTHNSGCGMAHSGPGIETLRRTIGGYARHPNLAAVLIVGLGCEVNQIDPLLAEQGLAPSGRVRWFGIQDAGGTARAIAAGVAEVEALLPLANAARRTPADLRHLIVGLQCGGSDGFSALSANPALGRASDLVVAHGGTVILSETPEIHGAEQLLVARARSRAVADRLIERVRWWEAHAAAHGADLNNNPSPGNIAGGITTILEKSLGAVAKSGACPLEAVLDYAEPVAARGVLFMDSPGYDPCSATGQIASGANLIAFTTGRGSAFGSKPAPTLKLASTSALARRMADDIDIDCGRLLTGEATLDQLGEEILHAMIATASGRRTRSEIEDVGDAEFVPWVPGAAM